MVGAAQGVLDVAENGIHPSKLGALDSGFSATHHHRLRASARNAAGRGDAHQSRPTHRRRHRVPVPRWSCAQAAISVRTEALDDGELHAQRVSLLVGRWTASRHKLGVLPGAPRAALAAASLATEIGVGASWIHPPSGCSRSRSIITCISLCLMPPRGVVGDTQMAHEASSRRDPFLVLGHLEVDGLKPHRQVQAAWWSLRSMGGPAVIERLAVAPRLHCWSLRLLSWQHRSWPQCGHRNPLGTCIAIDTGHQSIASSVP